MVCLAKTLARGPMGPQGDSTRGQASSPREPSEQLHRIAAIVVTYNRKHLLTDCLDALLAQTHPLGSIIVIDNASSDGTFDFLRKSGYLTNSAIEYIRLSENTGGAGGFAHGVRVGYERGFDWLWLMDDDALPREDALLQLTPYFSMADAVALASRVEGASGEIQTNHRGRIDYRRYFEVLQTPLPEKCYSFRFVDIDMASFVGLLIKAEVIPKVHYPREEFFIHHDDVDYCIRLRRQGRILLIPQSVIVHRDEHSRPENTKRLLGRASPRIARSGIWLSYFSPRNLVYLGKSHCSNPWRFYLQLLIFVARKTAGILLYDNLKKARLTCFLQGVVDGLRGDFTNRFPFLFKTKG